MAIYHMSVKAITRGKAQSVIAHAAYISGKALHDKDGEIKKYGREDRVACSEIFLPPNAPAEYNDPEILWRSVEESEKQVNAKLARSIDIALPKELSPEENIALARKIAKRFADQGMCVQMACHNLNDANPHMHLLVTVRRISKDGKWGGKAQKLYLLRNFTTKKEFYGNASMLKNANANIIEGKFEKVYRYKTDDGKLHKLTPTEAEKMIADGATITRVSRSPVDTKKDLTTWNAKSVLRQWRKDVADEINRALIEKEKITGHEITKVTEKSYKDRGLLEQGYMPTVHEGYGSRQLADDGVDVDKIAYNDAVKSHNDALAKEYSQLQGILQRLLIMIKERTEKLNEYIRKGIRRFEKTLEAVRVIRITGYGDVRVNNDDRSVDGREQQAQRIESQVKQREHQIEQREHQVAKLAGKAETRLGRYEHLMALAEACDVAYAELKAANLACESTQLPTYYQAKPHEILEKDILSVGKKPRIIGRKEWNEQCNIITKKWRDISLLYNLDIDLPDFDTLIVKKEELVTKIQAANKQYNANIKSVNDNRSNALKASQDADARYNSAFNKLAKDDPVLLGCGLQIEPKGYSLRPVHEVKASLPMAEEKIMQERVQVVFGKMRWEDTDEYQATHKHKNIDKSVRREDEYSRER